METWGYEEGKPDLSNGLQDTYSAMQGRLLAGANYVAGEIPSTETCKTRVALVGEAWRSARDENDIWETRLYKSDGEHPSALGGYLSALVMYGHVYDRDPGLVNWKPNGVNIGQRNQLRSIASAHWAVNRHNPPF